MTLLFDGPTCLVRRPAVYAGAGRLLSSSDAEEIRRRYENGESRRSIADMYGVDWNTINKIVKGITYRHPSFMDPTFQRNLIDRHEAMRLLIATTDITPRALAARYNMTLADVLAIIDEGAAA